MLLRQRWLGGGSHSFWLFNSTSKDVGVKQEKADEKAALAFLAEATTLFSTFYMNPQQGTLSCYLPIFDVVAVRSLKY